MAQRISRRNTPTSVCFGRWYVLLLPLGDVQVLDWLLGIPHDTTTYKARMIHKKKIREMKRDRNIHLPQNAPNSLARKHLRPAQSPESRSNNCWRSLPIYFSDLPVLLASRFPPVSRFPSFLPFLRSLRSPSHASQHKGSKSSEDCFPKHQPDPTKSRDHPGVPSIRDIGWNTEAPRNWNSQKENIQTKNGVSMNSRFFIASASAWICGFWAPVPGRSKTWNNECSSINTVRPKRSGLKHKQNTLGLFNTELQLCAKQ